MRPIDADALKDELELADFETDSRMFGGQTVLFEDSVFKIVDSAPTISPDEVRGVVKCKDCTFGESATDGDGNPCVLCGNSMVFDYPYAHDPDWFCADGEMKGAEDNDSLPHPR